MYWTSEFKEYRFEIKSKNKYREDFCIACANKVEFVFGDLLLYHGDTIESITQDKYICPVCYRCEDGE